MQNISYHIDKIARNVFRKKGFAGAQIITDWGLIIGDELLAKHSMPLKISYPPEKTTNGTLHVQVKSGIALEFKQREQEIIQKISSYFGFKAVDKIRIIQNQ